MKGGGCVGDRHPVGFFTPAGVQLCARVPHVEDEWKVPLISYRGEEVEVVGRGSLGLPVLRLPRPPHHSSAGLVFPPKFRPEGKG
jgi:hypothetical protein